MSLCDFGQTTNQFSMFLPSAGSKQCAVESKLIVDINYCHFPLIKGNFLNFNIQMIVATFTVTNDDKSLSLWLTNT